MPDNMRFETQDQNETIILILRRHWLTNFVWLTVGAIFIIFPFVLFPSLLMGGIITESIPSSVISFFLSFFAVLEGKNSPPLKIVKN